MNSDVRSRISFLFGIMRVTFHWGFIPTIIYLGFQKGADPGMPSFSLLSLLWQ
ncbi:mitochondrial import receptor subunit TOM7 homolog [Planococcus citri]|uniref:mitochondrial import receptor subunit TOM7 homolog n=1 Tax=Planococcus citri TaxID=170843 RepID=UPI0031F9188C